MKHGINELVGKTITGVVVASNSRDPRAQLFLIADDGTYLDVWGGDLHCPHSMERGGMPEALREVRIIGATLVRATS